ncbi:MAG: hypothetical protein QY326_06655 [Bdellovibrionota bacterium]|nr:MAG: hypothetical protein QY326_06655 [Bdellovibrionota bacterium]
MSGLHEARTLAVKTAGALALLLLLPGCILAPFIQAMSEAGVTEGDRQRLLAKDVREYLEAMRWNDTSTAVRFLDTSLHEDFIAEARKNRSRQKVVDGSVEGVICENECFDAEVVTMVRAYEVPYFVVREKREKTRWTFRVRSGWKMVERAPIEPEPPSSRVGG